MNVLPSVLLFLLCHISVRSVHGDIVPSSGPVLLKEKGDADADADAGLVLGDASTENSASNHTDDSADPRLRYMENKVWDIVAVTDGYGLEAEMAVEEDSIFIKAVEATGRKITRVSLEDEFDWRSTRSAVIRSAWAKFSYYEQYNDFLDMLDTQTYLFNPRQLTRWQASKINYMRQLAEYVKVPQTIVIRSWDDDYPDYEEAAEILGCADIIIKPAQGNSGIGVRLINAENIDLYEYKMEQYLKKKEDMLIQCFMYSISYDGPGEINVYIIDGQITHAGFSTPAKDHYLIHEERGGWGDDHDVTEQEAEYAMKVYKTAATITGTKPLYFRVDMMYDNDGDLTLMEIACGTTDMAFRDFPESADVMAKAMDWFLSKKEAEYEQAHGQKPRMIDLETFERLHDGKAEDYYYDWFGTPYRGGAYGKDQLWKKTLKRKCLAPEEGDPQDIGCIYETSQDQKDGDEL